MSSRRAGRRAADHPSSGATHGALGGRAWCAQTPNTDAGAASREEPFEACMPHTCAALQHHLPTVFQSTGGKSSPSACCALPDVASMAMRLAAAISVTSGTSLASSSICPTSIHSRPSVSIAPVPQSAARLRASLRCVRDGLGHEDRV